MESPGIEAERSLVLEAPLSLVQRDIYFDLERHWDTPVHSTIVWIELGRSVDQDHWRRAVEEVSRREPVFCARLVLTDRGPVQRASMTGAGMPTTQVDLVRSERASLTEWIRDLPAVSDPFRESGFASFLVKARNGNQFAVLRFPHLFFDGHSVKAFFEAVDACYSALSRGEQPRHEGPTSLGNVERPRGESPEAVRDYWRRRLEEVPALSFGTGSRSERGHTVERLRFSTADTGAIETFCAVRGVTPASFFLALYAVVLQRFRDGAGGLRVNVIERDRPRRDARQLGCRYRVLPHVLHQRELCSSARVVELMQLLIGQRLRARRFRNISAQEMKELAPAPGAIPFYNYYDFHRVKVLGAIREIQSHFVHPPHEVHLVVNARASGFQLTLLAHSGTLDARSILPRLRRLSQQVLRGAETVGELDWLLPEERAALDREAQRPVSAPAPLVLARLREHAARQPAATAIVEGDVAMTYADLVREVERVGAVLADLGLPARARVALLLEPSRDQVIAMLAVLAAGLCYVPIDPADPEARIDFIVSDAGARLVIQSDDTPAPRRPGGPATISLAELRRRSARRLARPPGPRAEDSAYRIYTSGSSGTPKGVEVSHQNLAALLDAGASVFRFASTDAWAYLHSYAFDFSVWELWGALYHGARLVILPRATARAPDDLFDALVRFEVSVLNQTPSAFAQLLGQMLTRGCPRSLRYVIFGGETLLVERLRDWFARFGSDGPQLVNMYGITETTVHVTYKLLTEGDLEDDRGLHVRSPIGEPLPHQRLYLVDWEGRPAPHGVAGELWVGGAGVSLGYPRASDADSPRFIPDPFRADGVGRVYRSGDRARRLPSGGYDFLGRIDDQVQLRGYRVEPAEIEAALGACAGVRRAHIIGIKAPDGADDLLAIVQPAPGQRIDEASLRAELGRKVPEYMTAIQLAVSDVFPTTRNGKLDVGALRARASRLPGACRPAATNEGGGLEAWIERAFAAVLGLPGVGPDDDFFCLGGHSLLAVTLLARLAKESGADVRLRSIFEHPTPRALAREFERAPSDRAHRPPTPAAREAEFPLTAAQERVWAIQTLHPDCRAYHFQANIVFDGPLDTAALEHSLSGLVERHEALRTSFEIRNKQPIQRVHRTGATSFRIVDLRALDPAGAAREAQQQSAAIMRNTWRLDRLPLVSWTLYRLPEERAILFHHEHHLIHDGWSFALLVRELLALYRAETTGRAPELLQPPMQLGDFARAEQAWLSTPEAEEQRAYWRSHFEVPPAQLEVPYDRSPTAAFSYRGQTLRHEIPDETWAAVANLARSCGTTPFVVLISAFAAWLLEVCGGDSACIASAVSNRSAPGAESVVGMALNNVLFDFALKDDVTFGEFLKQAQRTIVAGLTNSRLPYEQIAAAASARGPADVGRIFFSSYDGPCFETRVGDTVISVEPGLTEGTAKFDLNVVILSLPSSAAPRSERHVVLWEFSTDRFDAATMELLGPQYLAFLAQLANAPDCAVRRQPLARPADVSFWRTFNSRAIPYARSASITDLFSEVAARHPHDTALIGQTGRLTYRQLDDASTVVAGALAQASFPPESVVAVHLARRDEAIIALLGVLKAGLAYLPLDPRHPATYLGDLCMRGGARLLIGRGGVPGLPGLARLDWQDVFGARPAPRATIAPLTTSAPRPTGDSLAYVMFTSGSTGPPKAVEVRHRSVVRLVTNVDYVTLGPGRRVLQLAPLAFDAATFEIWGALLNAGTLVAPLGDVPTFHDIGRALADNQVTTLWLTASLFNAIVDADPHILAPVRQLVVGGEALSVKHVRTAYLALPEIQLVNGYGPTENTTFSTCYPIPRDLPDDQNDVPIGRPIPNSTAYVLDTCGRLAACGAVGEIHVGGDGLARGYRGDRVATDRAFIHPEAVGSQVVYKTGDLGRIDALGRLRYVGRKDEQLKVRGFRVAPSEVARAAEDVPGIARAAVVPRRTPDGAALSLFAVAAAERAPTPADLRNALKLTLPHFMIPSDIEFLPALPLTPNGKVDLTALASRTRPPPAAAPVTGFGTAHEQVVHDLLSDILGVPAVGLDDDFFDAGGNSLLAARLLVRLKHAFGREISAKAIYPQLTLRRLLTEIPAAIATPRDDARASRLVAVKPGGRKPPLVFVPGGDGGQGALIVYARLLRHMSSEQPFYGLVATGDPGGAIRHPNVEEMARDYLTLLRSESIPHFRLSGECVGGVVAFEMARQLQALGATAPGIVLLDAPPPSRWRILRHELWVTCSKLRAYFDRVQRDLDAVRASRYRALLAELPFTHDQAPPTVEDHWIDYQRKLLRYEPRPYRGDIDLILSAKEAATGEAVAGWRPFVDGQIRVTVVPGDHSAYLREHRETTAQALQDILDRHGATTDRLPGGPR